MTMRALTMAAGLAGLGLFCTAALATDDQEIDPIITCGGRPAQVMPAKATPERTERRPTGATQEAEASRRGVHPRLALRPVAAKPSGGAC